MYPDFFQVLFLPPRNTVTLVIYHFENFEDERQVYFQPTDSWALYFSFKFCLQTEQFTPLCAFAVVSLRKSNDILSILSKALSQTNTFPRYIFTFQIITGKNVVNYFITTRLLFLRSLIISLLFCLFLSTASSPN